MSTRTFEEAAALAQQHGFELTNPGDGCYHLRHRQLRWIYNLYPRRHGASPRIYSDKVHRGPYLNNLPQPWTLLDVTRAVIKASYREVTKHG